MSDPDTTRRLLAISCADALELITDHLEGALSEADAERMRAHLAGCEPCRVFLDQVRATIAVAQETRPVEEFSVHRDRVESLVELFRSERGD